MSPDTVCPFVSRIDLCDGVWAPSSVSGFAAVFIPLYFTAMDRWTDCGAACARREIAAYMDAVAKWRQYSGGTSYSDVYVATDGDTVMRELKEVCSAAIERRKEHAYCIISFNSLNQCVCR